MQQNKTNILITGGAGNIASALAAKLAENSDNRIVIVDNLLTGSKDKIPKKQNVTFIQADVNEISQLSPVFEKHYFTYVFHYAAVVGVRRTLENPLLVLKDIDGIKNILELSKNTKVKRVFYSSSSEVYGEPFEIPQNEDTTPLNSRLPYAIVKNVGEAFFKSYFETYGLHYTIFRFFNTYGPHQSEDFVVPRFLKAALNNKPITIYGNGLQTRTFCYVDDNVETCIRAMYSSNCANTVLNVGSDIEITILDLAKNIIHLTKSKAAITHLPALKEGDMTRRCPDITLMKTILNKKPTTLNEGLTKLIAHYTNQNG